jgi:hypothetical protein
MVTAKKTKLNKNARAWVKALRSGKYKQTKNVLTRVDVETGEIVGNCCLGVGCELAVKAKVIASPEIGLGGLEYDGENAILPTSVREWLGLKDETGNFSRGARNLSGENDGGKSFKQIARIIEQKAAELFV